MVHRPPKIAHLAIHLHVHLVEVPLPLAKATHAIYPLPADVAGKQLAEPVPPEAYRLMANVDTALWSRSSTLRKDSGYFTYISTARRITSGELLK